MTDLNELADRAGRGFGIADKRETDALRLNGDIALALHLFAPAGCKRGGEWARDRWFNSGFIEYQAPDFARSLDAAATLVPQGWDWSASSCGEGGASAKVWQHGYHDDTAIHSFDAGTPALCLVVAALRARAATPVQVNEVVG